MPKNVVIPGNMPDLGHTENLAWSMHCIGMPLEQGRRDVISDPPTELLDLRRLHASYDEVELGGLVAYRSSPHQV